MSIEYELKTIGAISQSTDVNMEIIQSEAHENTNDISKFNSSYTRNYSQDDQVYIYVLVNNESFL